MSMEIFLMAMQAAGAISDYVGTREQIRTGREGAKVEQAQLKTRLEEERLASTMQSLDAMKQLRQILATQRTIFAARGQAGGAGSAFFMGNKAVGDANSDERVRRMNLLSREAQLRSAGVLSGMHQLASETQLGQQLSGRMFDKIPFAEIGKKLGIGDKPTKKKTFGVEGV